MMKRYRKVDERLAAHAWLRAAAGDNPFASDLERYRQVAGFGETHGAS